MSFSLKSITRGVIVRPPRILLLGVEKIGKSTFCSEAPDPIFLPIKKEEGIDSLDVSSFPTINSFSDLMEALGVLAEGGHTFKTLVIDSASALEHLIWESVCADTGTTASSLRVVDTVKAFPLHLINGRS